MFCELAGRLGTDALCGRVCGAERRILLLEIEQLAIQLVVLGVRDGGAIEDVILVGRFLQLAAQRVGACGEGRIETHPFASSSMTCIATVTSRSSSSSDAFGRSVSAHAWSSDLV